MASCKCSSWWAELRASRRMSVSFRSFSHNSVRSSDTTFSSTPSPPSHSLETFRSHTGENWKKQHLTQKKRFWSLFFLDVSQVMSLLSNFFISHSEVSNTPCGNLHLCQFKRSMFTQMMMQRWRISLSMEDCHHHGGPWGRKVQRILGWKSPRCQRMALTCPSYWKPCWRNCVTVQGRNVT